MQKKHPCITLKCLSLPIGAYLDIMIQKIDNKLIYNQIPSPVSFFISTYEALFVFKRPESRLVWPSILFTPHSRKAFRALTLACFVRLPLLEARGARPNEWKSKCLPLRNVGLSKAQLGSGCLLSMLRRCDRVIGNRAHGFLHWRWRRGRRRRKQNRQGEFGCGRGAPRQKGNGHLIKNRPYGAGQTT